MQKDCECTNGFINCPLDGAILVASFIIILFRGFTFRISLSNSECVQRHAY